MKLKKEIEDEGDVLRVLSDLKESKNYYLHKLKLKKNEIDEEAREYYYSKVAIVCQELGELAEAEHYNNLSLGIAVQSAK